MAEKLHKTPQPGGKKTHGSFHGSAEAEFSPNPYSSHTDSEGEEQKKRDVPDKRYSGRYVKPRAKDLESKPTAKPPVYTRKSPLVPVTLSKSHICTRISTQISGKPKAISEVPTVTSPSQKHGIGGARPKTTAKADDSSRRRSDDEKFRKKSRKEKSKKSDSDDDWYSDLDNNTSKSTSGSVHVHKNQRDQTPVRESLSFKVIRLYPFILCCTMYLFEIIDISGIVARCKLAVLMAHFHQQTRTRIRIQIGIPNPIVTLYYAQLFPLAPIRIHILVQIVSRMVTLPILGTDLHPRDPTIGG